jgi:CBS domain containing-hemolysin-like protein
MNDTGQLILFLALLCGSAFFSATETAFFSLSPLRLKKLEEEGEAWAADVLAVLADKQRLLISLLLGNTLVNVVSTTIATRIIMNFVHSSPWVAQSFIAGSDAAAVAIASGVMTVLILFVGEITPKTVAIFNATRYARLAIHPLRIILLLMFPPVSLVIGVFQRFFPSFAEWNHKLGSATSMEEIDSYFSLGEEVGIIERDEKEMISSVFEFGDTIVREVMVPRPDIVALPTGTSLENLIKFFRDDGHSRFPVYDGTLDKIVGVIYVKDVLIRYEELRSAWDITQILRPVYFVPETKKLDEMLKEFQKRKIHLAVVVDEFGGVSGLVTIEDLLEEIVGEIVDEYDHDEQAPIVTVEPEVFSVDAKVSIEDLELELGVSLDYEDSETVGGFVLEKLGRIPKKDERVDEPQAVFVVAEVKGNRILRVRVTRKVESTLSVPQPIPD